MIANELELAALSARIERARIGALRGADVVDDRARDLFTRQRDREGSRELGQRFEVLLIDAALGDVPQVGGEEGVAGGLRPRDRHLDGDLGAVRVQGLELESLPEPRLRGRRMEAREAVAVRIAKAFREEDVAEALSHERGTLVTQCGLRGGVHGLHASVCVHDDDAVGGRLEDRRCARLGCREPASCVVHRADDPRDGEPLDEERGEPRERRRLDRERVVGRGEEVPGAEQTKPRRGERAARPTDPTARDHGHTEKEKRRLAAERVADHRLRGEDERHQQHRGPVSA